MTHTRVSFVLASLALVVVGLGAGCDDASNESGGRVVLDAGRDDASKVHERTASECGSGGGCAEPPDCLADGGAPAPEAYSCTCGCQPGRITAWGRCSELGCILSDSFNPGDAGDAGDADGG